MSKKVLTTKLETMTMSQDMEYLHPHLFIESLKNQNDEMVYDLFVLFKMDAANQTITLEEDTKADYPLITRVITIGADNVRRDTSNDNYFLGRISIPHTDRKSHESIIHVIIDHPKTPHGGSGSIHYPPG